MMFWHDHDMSGWGYAWMGIGMVLFWTLLILGIVVLIRFAVGANQPRAAHTPVPPVESPEQVLAARFARGEIEETEFQNRLTVLRALRT